MPMEPITIRAFFTNDIPAIEELYLRTAAVEGGLARTGDEITREYIEEFVSHSVKDGIGLLAIAGVPGRIIGEIHCYRKGVAVFRHMLSDLTIAVDPEHQGRGIGRMLFTELLAEVRKRPEIRRVELFARESNVRAIAFYTSLGFVQEGRLRGRILHRDGTMEDDLVMAWIRE